MMSKNNKTKELVTKISDLSYNKDFTNLQVGDTIAIYQYSYGYEYYYLAKVVRILKTQIAVEFSNCEHKFYQNSGYETNSSSFGSSKMIFIPNTEQIEIIKELNCRRSVISKVVSLVSRSENCLDNLTTEKLKEVYQILTNKEEETE